MADFTELNRRRIMIDRIEDAANALAPLAILLLVCAGFAVALNTYFHWN